MRLIRIVHLMGFMMCVIAPAPTNAQAGKGEMPWRIQGDLSEACSCTVPCPCNFGEGPSPYRFCWAMFSLEIREGHYGKAEMSGLRLAGAAGQAGLVLYIANRASPEQEVALNAIGQHLAARFREAVAATDPRASVHFLGIRSAHIDQEVGPKGNRLVIGDLGGFESDYILGIDGKTPVVVENNWSWNIQHGIKGKTRRLHYKDEFGNNFNLTATNANQGRFDWSDTTPVYFR